MSVMKNSHFWDLVKPDLEHTKWMKLPFWVAPSLSNIITTASEFWVLMYLINGMVPGTTKSIALTRSGLEYCGNLPQKTYYRAIKKFRQLGLTKNGYGEYEMSGLIKTLSLVKTPVNNIPLDIEEEDKFDDSDG